MGRCVPSRARPAKAMAYQRWRFRSLSDSQVDFLSPDVWRRAVTPGGCARSGKRSSKGQIQPKTYEEGEAEGPIEEIVLIVGVLSRNRGGGRCGRRESLSPAERAAARRAPPKAPTRKLRGGETPTPPRRVSGKRAETHR